MDICELINKLENNQVARGSYGSLSWYVIKRYGFIRYCDVNDNFASGDIASLTPSNIGASYEIIEIE